MSSQEGADKCLRLILLTDLVDQDRTLLIAMDTSNWQRRRHQLAGSIITTSQDTQQTTRIMMQLSTRTIHQALRIGQPKRWDLWDCGFHARHALLVRPSEESTTSESVLVGEKSQRQAPPNVLSTAAGPIRLCESSPHAA